MMRNNRQMGGFAEEIRRGLQFQDKRHLGVLAPATGLYAAHVERYRRVFGPRFKVLIFEEWMANIPETMRDVLDFLGVEHDVGSFQESPQRQYAEARGPLVRYLFGNRAISRAAEAVIPYRLRKLVRNAMMDRDAREFLVEYYRDDVRKLEIMLGRRLPWRNFGDLSPSRSVG
jgi:hypothetical protein